ncbi:hypothetical protein KPH14_001279 [Odynerus spinipes]|uniref:PiggyBac transposable element-derived protein domain-containing protein n=1 Tax=Odynerus spinipes TaxID=1348599 RepID=A0AAD9VL63_9HYME|nr:hypothetical protein KPH14_001279 [Odynerus spinipes]
MTTIRKRNAQIQVEKAAIVAEYNKHMGGVDTSDMMQYSYLDERRAIKYWKKVVFSIFSRMVLNAYILYRNNTDGKTKTRLEFITDVIQSITTEWCTETAWKTAKGLRGVQQKGWWPKEKITHSLQ